MQPTPRRAMIGERTQTLKAVPFFTQLSDRELDVVRAVSTEKTYPKNAVVLTDVPPGYTAVGVPARRLPPKDADHS